MSRDDATEAHDPAARAMARLLWRFEIMRRAEEQAEELRSAEGRLLWLLTQNDAPRTLKQIAQDLQLEQSTANRQVNAALRTGLLHRFREPGAGAWSFEPTQRGAALYERSLNCHLDRVSTALAALEPQEKQHLTHAFTTFIDAYAQQACRAEGTKEPAPHAPDDHEIA